MFCRVIIAAVVSGVLLPLPLAAQRVQRDPQAVDLLNQALVSTAQAASRVEDAVAEGQIRMTDGRIGSIRIENKGWRRIRCEISFSGQQIISVANEGKGYQVIDGNRQELPIWVTAYLGPDHIPALSRIAALYLESRTKLRNVGSTQVKGMPSQQVQLAVQSDDENLNRVEELISECHVFVDSGTRQIVQFRGFLFSPDAVENRSPVDLVLSDYRRVNGVPVPFRLERYISNHKHSEIEWSSVQLNAGVPDARFE